MRRLTGIELGPDACVLVRLRPDGDLIQVSAVHRLESDGSAAPHAPLSERLREVRRAKRFPRHARVVAWSLHQSASIADAATLAGLAPLRQAGFVVETILRPAEALAVLARIRRLAPGREAAAWLSINRHGAAIAIVHRGVLRYSRELDWNYRQAATSREDLLQRYSLVAYLAPELRHGFEVVRAETGAVVDAVITCGDLPDLRSLTMPLIEELDVEVETLDSMEGLRAVGPAHADDVVENAPAIRLACAAAVDMSPALSIGRPSRALRAVAAAALLALLGWGAYRLVADRTDRAATVAVDSRPAAQTPTAPDRPGSAARPPSTQAGTPAEPPDTTRPAATMGRGEPARQPRVVEESRTEVKTEQSRPGTDSQQERPPASSQSPANPGPPDRRDPTVGTERTPVPPRRQAVVPLTAPLPVVNSILVAPDRRLAVVDGAIVREGDTIGPRVLVRIEPGAVVLREPSGHEVRIFIRRRVGAAEGGASEIQLDARLRRALVGSEETS